MTREEYEARFVQTNRIREGIATGQSLRQLAITFGISTARVSAIRARMCELGWEPGQPAVPVTPKPAPPPRTQKYPGATASDRNRARWADPKYRAKMERQRRTKKYRQRQAKTAKRIWADRDEQERQRITAAMLATRARNGPGPDATYSWRGELAPRPERPPCSTSPTTTGSPTGWNDPADAASSPWCGIITSGGGTATAAR